MYACMYMYVCMCVHICVGFFSNFPKTDLDVVLFCSEKRHATTDTLGWNSLCCSRLGTMWLWNQQPIQLLTINCTHQELFCCISTPNTYILTYRQSWLTNSTRSWRSNSTFTTFSTLAKKKIRKFSPNSTWYF